MVEKALTGGAKPPARTGATKRTSPPASAPGSRSRGSSTPHSAERVQSDRMLSGGLQVYKASLWGDNFNVIEVTHKLNRVLWGQHATRPGPE